MSDEAHVGLRSPWLQAGRLAFLALFGVTLLAALAWAFSNVRQIGPENRAVVLRLGALERLAGPGLLLAWPQPLEQVVLLPSAEQVIERRVEGLQGLPVQGVELVRAVDGQDPDAVGVAAEDGAGRHGGELLVGNVKARGWNFPSGGRSEALTRAGGPPVRRLS